MQINENNITRKPKKHGLFTFSSMSEERRIPRILEMNEDLTRDNNELAERNHKVLTSHKIKTFDIVGAIGAGKTAILEKIVEHVSKGKECVCNLWRCDHTD